MQMQPYSLETLISLRKQIHENPEPGFKQLETKQRIINFLTSIGIQRQTIKQLAVTGMTVDIPGKKQPVGDRKIVAFRADMDALTMTQENPHLLYKSKKQGLAHMCGHDGHIVCLLSFVWKYLPLLNQIPSNKIIRLLFQPCQQGPESGAKLMIEEGALEGVNQVYGFHNWPTQKPGKIMIKEGPVMSQCVPLQMKIIGTKGHGSTPELVKDAVKGAVRMYQAIQQVKQQLKQKNLNFVCTLPVFRGGQRYNVFSQFCDLQGTIRSFSKGTPEIIIQRIKETISQLQKQGFKVQFKYNFYGPMVVNHKNQASHVQRVAKTLYGQQNVSAGILPVRASEDFSYFLEKVPGAFFFATSAKHENNPMLHSNSYDFNDQLIQKLGELWVRLATDRLRCEE